ncbi:carbohydrate kinase [Marinoscillum sp. MHG1-6]|uniref:carbohydrate kinase family protein n=1 Tax=Marinoscillum sp. MHG1-6 TaxID=2959627 RepID=UPI002157948A|nr:carbohydrate kinase [Marinoscillum sp. MHG1-6]
MKVLAFGEVLWDFIEGDKHFGGAPMNFAAHVRKCGGKSAIITAVGKDKLGDQAIANIASLGVSTDFVQVHSSAMTGRVMVFLKDGIPTYRIRKEVAYDYVDSKGIDLSMVATYNALYFGTVAQRNPVSRAALYQVLDASPFKTIFFDVNLRKHCFTADIICQSLKYCNIIKMNEDEIRVLSKLLYDQEMSVNQFVHQLKAEYNQINIVLVTLGGNGCTVFTNDDSYVVAAREVDVKDTVGSGDAFCAGFITTYMKTGDPKKAARIGNMVGGFVASQSGAVPDYPQKFARKIEILSDPAS